MLENIRNEIREAIRNLRYVMTIHAVEEMENDALTIFDVEHAVLTGEIVERQRDKATGELKYLIAGRSLDEDAIIVIVKLGATGKLVILTVYVESDGNTNSRNSL